MMPRKVKVLALPNDFYCTVCFPKKSQIPEFLNSFQIGNKFTGRVLRSAILRLNNWKSIANICGAHSSSGGVRSTRFDVLSNSGP
jgi:hypothetical protein